MIPGEDTSAKPRDRLALGNWMLILPVDDQGGTSGTARTVGTQELLDGYSSQWFHASDDGGVALFAPVNGALLPNSPNPVTELREVGQPDDPNANWLVTGVGQLTAHLAVHQVPNSSGTVYIGKIVGHQPAAAQYPSLMRVGFNLRDSACDGTLVVTVADAPSSTAPTHQFVLVDGGMQLNQEFDLSVRVDNGTLTVTSGTHQITTTIDSSWNSVPVYFMTGAGLGATGTSSTDGGGVTVFDVAVSH